MSEYYFDNAVDAILDDDFSRFCFYLEKLQEKRFVIGKYQFLFLIGLEEINYYILLFKGIELKW